MTNYRHLVRDGMKIPFAEIEPGVWAQVMLIHSDGDVVSLDNPLPNVEHRAPESHLPVVMASTTSQTAMPVNTSRHGLILENKGNTICHIKMAAGPASNTPGNVSFSLRPRGKYEPTGPTVHLGEINVVWDAPTSGSISGWLAITEFQ